MNDSTLIDLDHATDKAWRRYRHELADRMSDLELGESIGVTSDSLIDQRGTTCVPCLEFRRDGAVVLGRLTGECLNALNGAGKKSRR